MRYSKQFKKITSILASYLLPFYFLFYYLLYKSRESQTFCIFINYIKMLSDMVPDVLKPIQQANLNADIKIDEFGPNFKVILINDQIRELQTVIRDK